MKEKILILLLILALAVLLIVAAVFYNRLGTDAAPDNLAEEGFHNRLLKFFYLFSILINKSCNII